MKKEVIINNSIYVFDGETLELYFKNDDINEQSKIEKVTKVNCEDNKVLYKLVFNVANVCNLNCRYCYANGGNYNRKNEKMKEHVIDETLKKIFNKYDKVHTVYFFGGEPLLNFDIIKYIISKMESRYRVNDIDFRVVTNGICLTKRMATYFEKLNFKVYISIDGPKYIHEYLRGSDTFDIIIEKIKKIKEEFPLLRMELLCTYTKYHQDNISFENLVNFFEKIDIPFSINGVDTSDENLKLVEKSNFIDREKEYIDVSIKRILTFSNNVGISYYLATILSTLLFKHKQDVFCKELSNNYSSVIDFDGTEYSCIRLIGKYVKNSNVIANANKKNFEVCKNCWCRNFCNVCLAEILLGTTEYPFFNGKCSSEQLYSYALNKIIKLINNNYDELKKLLNNYCKKYLK